MYPDTDCPFSVSVTHDSKCVYPDASGDLYEADCDGTPKQKYTVFEKNMLKLDSDGGKWAGKCLLADGGMWPKLRNCDPSNAKMRFSIENFGCDNGVCDLKINLKDTTKCLDLGLNMKPANRLLFVDCPSGRGVSVDGSWVHPRQSNSLGKYFKYDKVQWAIYFGTPILGGVVDVKQCRDGAKVWNGKVKVWPVNPDGNGRRNSGSARGQWEEHDYVVKVCSYCDD